MKKLLESVKHNWSLLESDTQNFIKSFILVSGAVVIFIVAFGLGKSVGVPKDEYALLETNYNDTINDLKKAEDKLKNNQSEIDSLEEKANISKEYLSLNETEKQVVDNKISEVKKATQDQLEAEKKAEEERKAQEEAQKKAEEEKKKQEEQAKKESEEQAKREAEAHKYETGLTWEQIAREGKEGELGNFEGKILQVMEGTGVTQYRIAINGDYNTVMLVEVINSQLKETLLEDDYVYFKGVSAGTTSYTSIMGAKITIPSFYAHEITRIVE